MKRLLTLLSALLLGLTMAACNPGPNPNPTPAPPTDDGPPGY